MKQRAVDARYRQCMKVVFREYHDEVAAGLYQPGALSTVCHDWARKSVR